MHLPQTCSAAQLAQIATLLEQLVEAIDRLTVEGGQSTEGVWVNIYFTLRALKIESKEPAAPVYPAPPRAGGAGTAGERQNQPPLLESLAQILAAAAAPPRVTVAGNPGTQARTPASVHRYAPAFKPSSPHSACLPRLGGRVWISNGEGRWYVVTRGLEVGVFNGW